MNSDVRGTVEEERNQVGLGGELHLSGSSSLLPSHTLLFYFFRDVWIYGVDGWENGVEVFVHDVRGGVDETSIKVAAVDDVDLCDVDLSPFWVETGRARSAAVATAASHTQGLINL